MSEDKPAKRVNKDPLHGVTLKMMLTELLEKYGWKELARLIKINCFANDPSINSSLKFLRRTPWARQKVEKLYLNTDWKPADVWANSRKFEERTEEMIAEKSTERPEADNQ